MTLAEFEVTRTLAVYSSLFLAVFGLWKWSRLATPLRIFVVLKIVSFLCDKGAEILRMNGINPNHTNNLYGILGTLILLYFYYVVFQKPFLKKTFIITGIAISAFMLLNWLYLQKEAPNSYSYTLFGLLSLLLGLAYYSILLKELPEKKLSQLPLFWINSGQVLYSTGTLLLFIVTDYLVHVIKDDLITYWSFHNVIGILANIIVFVGIWLGAKEKKLKTHETENS